MVKDRQGVPEGRSDRFLNQVALLKRLVGAWTARRGLPPLTDKVPTARVTAPVVSLPRLVCWLWGAKASAEEAGLVSVTFSCRTYEQYLQMQREVALHAEVLCKLLPGGRASLLQQVQKH